MSEKLTVLPERKKGEKAEQLSLDRVTDIFNTATPAHRTIKKDIWNTIKNSGYKELPFLKALLKSRDENFRKSQRELVFLLHYIDRFFNGDGADFDVDYLVNNIETSENLTRSSMMKLLNELESSYSTLPKLSDYSNLHTLKRLAIRQPQKKVEKQTFNKKPRLDNPEATKKLKELDLKTKIEAFKLRRSIADKKTEIAIVEAGSEDLNKYSSVQKPGVPVPKKKYKPKTNFTEAEIQELSAGLSKRY